MIFIGLTGTMISITLFGLSKSLTWALLARSLGETHHIHDMRCPFLAHVSSLSGCTVWECRVCPIPIIVSCALTEPCCSVIKSILGEITNPTNEAQVMPLVSIMWNVGAIIGPILGGTLSTPAQQYPNSFVARVRLFQDYPYVYHRLLCYSYSVLSLLGTSYPALREHQSSFPFKSSGTSA